jgi:hypothetical protein
MKVALTLFRIVLLSVIILLQSSISFGGQDHSILIVLDSSKRMAEDTGGQSKLQLAKQFVQEFANANIPASIGLTVFGADEISGIEAYFSPVLPGENTGRTIIDELDALEPAGMSPIASALAYGSQSFDVTNTNYIVLITDGVEDSGGGPISTVESLLQQGLLYRLDVVGFMNDVEDNRLLEALVQSGEGRYFPIGEANVLIQNYLTEISEDINNNRSGMIGYRCFINEVNSFPAYGVEIKLKNSTGQEIDSRAFWRGIFENLVPGNYFLTARQGDVENTVPIEVVSGNLNDYNFVFQIATGGITFRHLIRNTQDGRAYGTITRVYHSSGEMIYTGTSWQGKINNLPEGDYLVEATFEGMPVQTKQITVQQGSTPDAAFEFNIERGRISYQCFLNQSQTNAANGTAVKMFRMPYNELVLEQNLWRATTPYLPTGEYMIQGYYKGIIRQENTEIHSDSTSQVLLTFNIVQVRFTYQCFRNELRKTPATGVVFQVLDDKGTLIEESNFWRGSFQLPEGQYSLKAQYQGITKIQTLNLFASSEPIISVINFEM